MRNRVLGAAPPPKPGPLPGLSVAARQSDQPRPWPGSLVSALGAAWLSQRAGGPGREAARRGTVTLAASRGSGDTVFQTLSSRTSEDELGTHPEQGCRNPAPLLAPGPWCYYPARKLAHPTRAGDQTWKNV